MAPWRTTALLVSVAAVVAAQRVSPDSDMDELWPAAAQERIRTLEAKLEGELARTRVAEDRTVRLASRLLDAMRATKAATEAASKALDCSGEQTVTAAAEREANFRTRPGEVDSTGALAGQPTPESVHNAALRDEIWRLYEAEAERQRRAGLDDDRDPLGEGGPGMEGGPKSISISCAQLPSVSVTPLHDDEVEQGECMVLSLTAPELDARLVVFCDGRVSTAGMG